MKTIHRVPTVKGQKRLCILKGAPEIVLKSCSHYMHKGTLVPVCE
jgi:magnesium-transporting ATPase (P-type)